MVLCAAVRSRKTAAVFRVLNPFSKNVAATAEASLVDTEKVFHG